MSAVIALLQLVVAPGMLAPPGALEAQTAETVYRIGHLSTGASR